MEEPIPRIPSTVAGSSRVTTPIKQRAVTPTTRPSELRTSSAHRLRIVHTITEAQPAQKYISRRKQRKWENANMILLNRFLSLTNNSSETDQTPIDSLLLQQTKPFSWSKLDENDKLSLFSLHISHDSASKGHNSKRVIRTDEWELEEATWINKVRKQLRSVIIPLIHKHQELCDYLMYLELIICCYIDTRTTPLHSEFSAIFLSNLEVNSTIQVNEVGKCIFILNELPLHRLITFATCQFYGLHSDVSCLCI